MIRVNGAAIADDAVAREMQHHPAETREDAERQAATALVVRELLLQRVGERDVAGATEDERIANLIDKPLVELVLRRDVAEAGGFNAQAPLASSSHRPRSTAPPTSSSRRARAMRRRVPRRSRKPRPSSPN